MKCPRLNWKAWRSKMLALRVYISENQSLNRLESKNTTTLKRKKYRVKSVTNVDINMATTNVTQKESDVPSAKS